MSPRESTTGALLGAGVRLVIFDADGTLRLTTVPGQPCPHAPDEWRLMPGVREQLGAFAWAASSVRVGIASNQDHVGYGLLTAELADTILRDMVLAATDGQVRDPIVRFCPHTLDIRCECRKPAPGMLLSIMQTAGASPEQSVFVGNAWSDEEAARRAHMRFVHAADLFAPRQA
jgi:D-glycero-D-manno-heptose 1,7-bisphosphate phosphatase